MKKSLLFACVTLLLVTAACGLAASIWRYSPYSPISVSVPLSHPSALLEQPTGQLSGDSGYSYYYSCIQSPEELNRLASLLDQQAQSGDWPDLSKWDGDYFSSHALAAVEILNTSAPADQGIKLISCKQSDGQFSLLFSVFPSDDTCSHTLYLVELSTADTDFQVEEYCRNAPTAEK